MFIPLHDGTPMRHLAAPRTAWTLIAVNVGVWLAGRFGLFGDMARVDTALGAIPAVLLGHAELAASLALVPSWATPFTAMFLHGNLFHLVGNMLFLWVFGDNVEDAMGHLRFLLFYLACGLAGTLLYAGMAPQSEAPLIGASGAVSGVIVAYLMLHPRVRVFGLVFNWLPLRIPAYWCLGLWIVFQIVNAVLGGESEVGWWAHVGGILAGAVLTPLMRRPGVVLFSARK